jgi:NADH:ubiquinone oxidoreductase subunit C
MRKRQTDTGLHVANLLLRLVPNFINQIQIMENTNELRILTTSNKLKNLLVFFKNHNTLYFQALQDLFAIDYIDYSFSKKNVYDYEINKNERFQVNYYLLNLVYEMRILIKVNISNLTVITSVSSLYNSASWLEREIWDLFGIYFKGHPDLRRILTDYGFEGHALRKDFPLSGYTEIIYTTELKKITVKALELTQEYRAFDFVSPWDIKKI